MKWCWFSFFEIYLLLPLACRLPASRLQSAGRPSPQSNGRLCIWRGSTPFMRHPLDLFWSGYTSALLWVLIHSCLNTTARLCITFVCLFFSFELNADSKPRYEDPLLQLVSLQEACGRWLLDPALAIILGKSREEVKKAKPTKVCDTSAFNNNKLSAVKHKYGIRKWCCQC